MHVQTPASVITDVGVVALAAYAASRIIALEQFGAPLRDRTDLAKATWARSPKRWRRVGAHLAYAPSCPVCSSAWAALAAAQALPRAGTRSERLIIGLAAAAITMETHTRQQKAKRQ